MKHDMKLFARELLILDPEGNKKSLQMSIISFNTTFTSSIDLLYRALFSGKEIAVSDVSFNQFECERAALLLVEGPLSVSYSDHGITLSMSSIY